MEIKVDNNKSYHVRSSIKIINSTNIINLEKIINSENIIILRI